MPTAAAGASRRELLLAGAAALVPRRPALVPAPRMEWEFDVKKPQGRGFTVRVGLEGRGRSTLRLVNGIGGRLWAPPESPTPDFHIYANRTGALAWFADGVPFQVHATGGYESLVTAWTLPLLGVGGLTAFDVEDLRRMNSPAHWGRFFNLPLSGSALTPRAVAEAGRADRAYAVCFGGDFSLRDVDAAIAGLDAHLPKSADRLFATALRPGHENRLLLTLFPRDLEPTPGGAGGCIP